MDANVFFSLHNEDEAGSVRAETRGHPRKLSKSRYVRRLDKDNFCFQSCKSLEQAPFRCSDGTRSYNSFSTL